MKNFVEYVNTTHSHIKFTFAYKHNNFKLTVYIFVFVYTLLHTCFNTASSDEKFSNEIIARSSRREVFCEKGVLRNLAKFTGKHQCQILFFNKVAGL